MANGDIQAIIVPTDAADSPEKALVMAAEVDERAKDVEVEETDEGYMYTLVSAEKFDEESLKTSTLENGVKVVYGVMLEEDEDSEEDSEEE
ncbi:MAG: hypothetical protein GF414_01550 [Candidatus Altiarchaeales archaeon]|nr:hypothetical protein [Candidatus Altiarchaeales archaeon]